RPWDLAGRSPPRRSVARNPSKHGSSNKSGTLYWFRGHKGSPRSNRHPGTRLRWLSRASDCWGLDCWRAVDPALIASNRVELRFSAEQQTVADDRRSGLRHFAKVVGFEQLVFLPGSNHEGLPFLIQTEDFAVVRPRR